MAHRNVGKWFFFSLFKLTASECWRFEAMSATRAIVMAKLRFTGYTFCHFSFKFHSLRIAFVCGSMVSGHLVPCVRMMHISTKNIYF